MEYEGAAFRLAVDCGKLAVVDIAIAQNTDRAVGLDIDKVREFE